MLIALKVLATLIALPVLVELLLRLWLRKFGRYYVWLPYERQQRHLDQSALPGHGSVARIDTNSLGARGRPMPKCNQGIYHVVTAGGSAVECYFLDQPSTWPERFGEYLDRTRRFHAQRADKDGLPVGMGPVQVNNIGRSGYTCVDVGRVLARVLPTLPKVDLLLLMVGAGDFIRWMEERLPAGGPPPSDINRLFALHPENIRGFGLKATRRVAIYWRQRLIRPKKVRWNVGQALASARGWRQNARTIVNEIGNTQELLGYFDAVIRDTIAIAKAGAARVVVVLQPSFGREPTDEENRLMWSFGDGRIFVDEIDTYYSHRLVLELMASINTLTAAAARQLGVEVIGAQAAVDPGKGHFYDFMHLTPAGARELGKFLVHRIFPKLPAPSPEKSASEPGAKLDPKTPTQLDTAGQ